MGDGNKRLLDYVPELLTELANLQAEQDAAAEELRRIDEAISKTEIALHKRRSELKKPDRATVCAEAALRGEPPPPEPKDPPGVTPRDLEATIDGLRARQVEPKQQIDRIGEMLRGKTLRAFRVAAERAAADLVAAVQRVEALHAEIGAAQRIVEMQVNPPSADVILGTDWWTMSIPSTDRLGALQPATVFKYGRPYLAGGDRDGLHAAASKAYEAAKSVVRKHLGGRWPLERR